MKNREKCWELFNDVLRNNKNECAKFIWKEFCNQNDVNPMDGMIRSFFEIWYEENVGVKVDYPDLIPEKIEIDIYYRIDEDENQIYFETDHMREQFENKLEELIEIDWIEKNLDPEKKLYY